MTSPSEKKATRQKLEALSGLLLAMFCSMLSMTVVGSSMPIIVDDLGGTQTQYTWVITMTLLTTAISTPIWGKLADLVNRKVLMLTALVLFVLASAGAGLSQSAEMLIFFRALQGIGGGGLQALSQVLMADILSPRERGKYMGLFAGVMSIGTVGGPLLGGFLTDTISWHWNFYVGVPLGIAAFIVLTKTLKIHQAKPEKVRIDYFGIVLLSVAAGFLLVWISNVQTYGWASWETLYMVGIAVVATVGFIIVEMKVAEPLIPMTLFRNKTFTLAVLASISIGVSMFGTAVYLAQYMQVSRGFGPTEAGLMTIPMALGMMGASVVIGQLVSRTGKWKRYVVTGGVLMVIGTSLLSTLQYDTSLVLAGVFMFVLGAGTGMTMQNLVLVVQNSTNPREIGVASSGVNFFRSVGGTVGVAVMGSVLAASMTNLFDDRKGDIEAAIAQIATTDPAAAQDIGQTLTSGGLPPTRGMPEAIATIIEQVSATSISHAFLVGVPLALLSLIAICFLPNTSLNRKNTQEQLKAAQEKEASSAVVSAAPAEPSDEAWDEAEREHPGYSEAWDVALASTGAVRLPVRSETEDDDDAR
ncbi:MAG: MDR family MFS transporter [Microbacterium gubbeenense]|uniref:MDR family MFS transporter n=6 Tax=Microbacterium gubbeenense TaxID=159896 RepID=UPI0003F8BE2E|nr:DHA2 family efflux MFS transporter permease subunit [Microbacterium gubbeenense]